VSLLGGPQPGHRIAVTNKHPPPQPWRAASASATSQPTAAGAAAGCLTRYLNGSIGLTQGTAGALEVTIVVKNLDNVSCTLSGFPAVALAAGMPVTDVTGIEPGLPAWQAGEQRQQPLSLARRGAGVRAPAESE
jgi:hypothetical protein